MKNKKRKGRLSSLAKAMPSAQKIFFRNCPTRKRIFLKNTVNQGESGESSESGDSIDSMQSQNHRVCETFRHCQVRLFEIINDS